ncbi:hypothetical protein CUZ56_01197 [Saezia sanguinis]|uniref:Uncharacterized protein n=1 Tax=Saezia sanguinis TaxID=1965230 RepID=A0A433SF40_9BURK|nr:hypothetical protein CUZ56_01197 [Saezia sanguinis]
MRTLDNPAMTAQPLFALNPLASDAGGNTPASQRTPASAAVVSLISMQLVRAFARPAIQTRHSRDCIQCLLECHRIMAIGTGHRKCQRDSSPIYDEVALAAKLALVRRIRARFLTPRGLATLAPSMLARSQSIWSCSRKRRSIARCNFSHTPAACQSRNLRQHVILLPNPSCCGKSSHGMPVWRTNIIPFNAARSLTARRPPLGDGENSGISGSRAVHNSLLILRLVITAQYDIHQPMYRLC